MCLHLSWRDHCKEVKSDSKTGDWEDTVVLPVNLCYLFEQFQGQECAYAFPDSNTK